MDKVNKILVDQEVTIFELRKQLKDMIGRYDLSLSPKEMKTLVVSCKILGALESEGE